MRLLRRQCLTVARLALAGWVGAATLFVINGVRLVTSGVFDSVDRDHISLLRFPPYYLFGFVLMGVAVVSLAFAGNAVRRWVLGVVLAAGLIMLADYLWVYRPLEAMITPPGQARSPRFETLHRASMIVNFVHVGLCLVAAIAISRPVELLERRDV